MRARLPPVCLALVPVACTPDNALQSRADGQTYAANIEVTPSDLAFEALALGGTATRTLTISNTGTATLYVASIEVEGSGAFSLPGWREELAVGIGEAVELEVLFAPRQAQDEGALVIGSTDPDTPEITLPLSGEGLFPALDLSPDPYPMGEHLTLCGPVYGNLTLTNAGEALATVSGVSATGGGWSVHEPPALPFTLEPGASVDLGVALSPTIDAEYQGVFWVESDDPAGPSTATLSATTTTWTEEEHFVQGAWPETDVLLTIDRSGSMSDDAEILSGELPTLVDALDAIGTDYQIAVVTRDNGCHNEVLITSETTHAESRFRDAVFGPSGTYTEAGLTLARNALREAAEGGCTEGFLREDARVSILHVTDEPEQSLEDRSELLEEILALAPTATISAVAGPVPDGCGTASPGTGYDEAVEATGGAFESLCDADWEVIAESMADLSMGGGAYTDTFVLDETPWPETVEVRVDDDEVTDWSYNSELNAIVFDEDEVPRLGAAIEVRYAIGTCD